MRGKLWMELTKLGMKLIPNFSMTVSVGTTNKRMTLTTKLTSRDVVLALQVRKKSQNGSGSHEQPKIAWGRRIHEVSHLGLCENGDLPPIYGHFSRESDDSPADLRFASPKFFRQPNLH